jgi:hypothetical protein
MSSRDGESTAKEVKQCRTELEEMLPRLMMVLSRAAVAMEEEEMKRENSIRLLEVQRQALVELRSENTRLRMLLQQHGIDLNESD